MIAETAHSDVFLIFGQERVKTSARRELRYLEEEISRGGCTRQGWPQRLQLCFCSLNVKRNKCLLMGVPEAWLTPKSFGIWPVEASTNFGSPTWLALELGHGARLAKNHPASPVPGCRAAQVECMCTSTQVPDLTMRVSWDTDMLLFSVQWSQG